MTDREIHDILTLRIGREHLDKRLAIQQRLRTRRFNGMIGKLPYKITKTMDSTISFLLRLTGQYNRGLKNALDCSIETNSVRLQKLPDCFHGFRILHISDLHFDIMPGNGRKLLEIIQGLQADLCVITGDSWQHIDGHHPELPLEIATFFQELNFPHGIFGVLGNNDLIESVPLIEKNGVKILLNEAVPIDKGDTRIWLAGLDDPHFYRCHNIEKALVSIPSNAMTIMLAHSPEVYKKAQGAGVNLLLCGHTHGGQICLPGGTPLFTNARGPRRFCSGSWQYKTMPGYTSRGAGASRFPIRFNCPPEITLHEFY